MRITVDTNVLLRAVLVDDPIQSKAAVEVLESAELVAIGLPTLCEFVWVLERQYKAGRAAIAKAIRLILDTHNVTLDRPAAEAGLAMLAAGGDFADGIIAHDGAWRGGETFLSFDKKAVSLLVKQGHAAQLLA